MKLYVYCKAKFRIPGLLYISSGPLPPSLPCVIAGGRPWFSVNTGGPCIEGALVLYHTRALPISHIRISGFHSYLFLFMFFFSFSFLLFLLFYPFFSFFSHFFSLLVATKQLYMTRCKQRAHLLPTRFLDIFFITNAKFFAPLHFLHACRMLPHSSVTTSDHRQDVINVLWQKNREKSLEKNEKKVTKFQRLCF